MSAEEDAFARELRGVSVLHRSARARQEEKRRDGVTVIDVTSHGPEPWKRFSPFYPHGGIPVPLWPGRTAQSVEGIWQGLKRFEHEDTIDLRSFDNDSLRGLKRTSRARGRDGVARGCVLGHQAGQDVGTLLGYVEARRRIYLPAYRWVLEHRLRTEITYLRELALVGPIVLLDYTTNEDVVDDRKPLSHAALVKADIDGRWPSEAML